MGFMKRPAPGIIFAQTKSAIQVLRRISCCYANNAPGNAMPSEPLVTIVKGFGAARTYG